MKSTVAFAVLLGLVAASDSAGDHPIEQVVDLLKDLMTKVESEGKNEAVSYTKFEYWCRNSAKTLNKAIADEKAAIDTLESKVAAKTKEKAQLEQQIEDLEKHIVKLLAKESAANSKRGKAEGLYVETSADIQGTIDAIKGALTALESAGTSTEGLVQVRKALALAQVVAQTRRLEQPIEAAGDLGAHVDKYNFKSGSVIELLKGLQAKFEDELLASNKAETNSLNSHALSTQARDAELQAARDAKLQKTGDLGEVTGELEAAQATLTDEEADLEADSATLEETDTSCSRRKREWAERSETREQELAAMQAAIKILAKSAGVRTEAPSNPVPPPSPASFLQVVDPKMKAVNLLREQAHKSHSKQLERLAQEMAAHLDGPFDDLLNMIQKMIFRLMAEQKDEDDHKNWCDKELSKTDASKADKEAKLEELAAKIDANDATVQTLSEDIKAANEMVNTITAHVKEATEIRETGKQENTLAIKDAKSAQTSIANAVAVLEQFYKDNGMITKEKWELLQEGPDPVSLPDEPALWGPSYTGTDDPNTAGTGIIAVLKATSAKFAKMEADSNAQESMDQKDFENDMKASDIEKARRLKESDVKAEEKKRLIAKVEAQTKQRKHVSDEKDAVDQYLEDLKPACVDGDSTYEERKAARDEEIGALKSAQGTLTDAFKDGGKGGKGGASFLAMHF